MHHSGRGKLRPTAFCESLLWLDHTGLLMRNEDTGLLITSDLGGTLGLFDMALPDAADDVPEILNKPIMAVVILDPDLQAAEVVRSYRDRITGCLEQMMT